MFPYDTMLFTAVQSTPQNVADVVRVLEKIESTCAAGDGLKWFNGLYLDVTRAVQARVDGAGFADPAWMAALDVRFARYYFDALKTALTGGATAGCWQALFAVRGQAAVARIQFALAGMNAHINHDLALAVLDVCGTTGIAPRHGTTHYDDFTALNTTLDSLIDAAKEALQVRLLGDALPPMSKLEDTLAAWSMCAARESAWNNAELLAHLAAAPEISATFIDMLDGLTTVAGKALLVPVV